MAISNKPRRCYHRFVEGGRFCMSPGCGVPRHYVEQAEPLPGAAEGGSSEGPCGKQCHDVYCMQDYDHSCHDTGRH